MSVLLCYASLSIFMKNIAFSFASQPPQFNWTELPGILNCQDTEGEEGFLLLF